MTTILIHGLGQDRTSWNTTRRVLASHGIQTVCPTLFDLIDGDSKDYHTLYNKFAAYCNAYNDPLHLCGLSLGGVLALDYAKEFPDKVQSLVLIGTPYRIPKALFKLQSIVFHLMPPATFTPMGTNKRDFITLVSSMATLDIPKDLDRLCCETLILCGQKDRVNMKSATHLQKHIKHSHCHFVENSGHEVNIDNPQALAQCLGDFYKAHLM